MGPKILLNPNTNPKLVFYGFGTIFGSKGAPGTRPKFFHFHTFFGKKFAKIIPLWELVPPPQENPGSATGNDFRLPLARK